MPLEGTIGRVDRRTWMTMDGAAVDPAVVARCTPEAIQKALAGVGSARVVSVALNESGEWEIPDDPILGFPRYTEEGLPPYCETVVEFDSPGGHTVRVEVWVPLRWNGRFLGLGGGNNRTRAICVNFPKTRFATPATALRNGFAAATSDAGVGDDPRFFDWELDEATGKLDADLIENWVHRSTHEMTAIGKAVTSAIHGHAPVWSYFNGVSGGGRQAVAQAQRYPGDYDGVWGSDPAINWTRFVPAILWPSLVMKEHHVLSPVKLEAFRAAVLESGTAVGEGSDGYEAGTAIGRETAEGPITASDARVMQLIWDGPRTPEGERLWFGLLPGIESWDPTVGAGHAMTADLGNGLEPVPLGLGTSWFATWLMRDAAFDWHALTFERYAELFQRGVSEFATLATDDPDFSGLRDSGNKLLLTQGVEDQIIPCQGATQFYEKVIQTMGGLRETTGFARYFLCPGDGHGGAVRADGGVTAPSLDAATGMIALMRWVEEGVAPDQLELHSFDAVDDRLVSSHSVDLYGA